jgi:hypothetical protein
MATYRIRIDDRIIKNLKNQYEQNIVEEYKKQPTLSQIVTVALLDLECLKTGKEINIKFLKNDKILYKFK